jgi:hypothetical protein
MCFEVEQFRNTISKMLEVGEGVMLHSKIINDKAKGDITSFMTEQAWCVSLNVVVCTQLGNKADLG